MREEKKIEFAASKFTVEEQDTIFQQVMKRDTQLLQNIFLTSHRNFDGMIATMVVYQGS